MIPVRCGNALVKVYEPKTGSRFQVVYYRGDRRIIEARTTKASAISRAKDVARQLADDRPDSTELSRTEIEAYRHAMKLLRPTGVPLVTALEDWIEHRRRLSITPKPVPDVVAEFVEHKRPSVSHEYLRVVRVYLDRLASDCPANIHTITAAQLEKWLDSIPATGRSRMNYRGALTVLWSFARSRQYVPKGTTAAEEVAKIKPTAADVEIFTPGEMSAILDHSDPKDALYAAIRGFAGVRGSELARADATRRLSWSDVLWENKLIQVTAGKSKTRSRRVIPIEPNLLTWLEPYRGSTGPICEDQDAYIQRRLMETGRVLGIRWKKNGLRRSYASYLYALTDNEQLVASRTGHSPAILFRNYRGIATKQQAQEWFSIAPK